MDSICILLGIKLYQREYLEYKIERTNLNSGKKIVKSMKSKTKKSSRSNKKMNYADLIGISSLFGCCTMGLIANFTSYNNYIKFFSNTFCFLAVFFLNFSCIKYMRISNKMAILI